MNVFCLAVSILETVEIILRGNSQLSHREVDPIDEKLRPLQSENKQIFGPIYSRKGGDLLRSRPVPRNMSTVTYGRRLSLTTTSRSSMPAMPKTSFSSPLILLPAIFLGPPLDLSLALPVQNLSASSGAFTASKMSAMLMWLCERVLSNDWVIVRVFLGRFLMLDRVQTSTEAG